MVLATVCLTSAVHPAEPRLALVRIRRRGRNPPLVAPGAQLIEQVRDGRVELGIVASQHVGRQVLHHLVRLHAPALDEPVAGVQAVEAELGRRGAAAVDQVLVGLDADAAAPGAHADDVGQALVLDGLGEELAVAAGVLVDQHGQRPVERTLGVAASLALARDGERPERALEPVDDHVAHEAAAVEALVDDHGLQAGLRVPVGGELHQAGLHHVGQVQVADAAAGGLEHRLAVALHPRAVTQAPLAAQGLHRRGRRGAGPSPGCARCGSAGRRGGRTRVAWLLAGRAPPASIRRACSVQRQVHRFEQRFDAGPSAALSANRVIRNRIEQYEHVDLRIIVSIKNIFVNLLEVRRTPIIVL